NTVYGAAGATITSLMGGNTVIQNFDQTEANSVLAASQIPGSTTASAALTTAISQTPSTFFDNTAVQQSLVSTNPTVLATLISGSTAAQGLLAADPTTSNLLATNSYTAILLSTNENVAKL